MLRFALMCAAAQAAILNGWVFTPQGYLGTGSTACGQNFTIVYSVSNAISNLSSVSVQSTGGGGGGGTTTVGTPLTVPFLSGVNTTVNYTCPATFVPGFGGTRYTAVITVDTTTFKSPAFSIVAAASPSRTPTLTPTSTPTPSMSNGSTATPTPSATPSMTPSLSLSSTATPTSSTTTTTSVSSTPTPSPSSPPVLDIKAIQDASQATSMAMTGGVIGGIAVLVVCTYGITRLWQRRQRRLRRLRSMRTIVQRRQLYTGEFAYVRPQ